MVRHHGALTALAALVAFALSLSSVACVAESESETNASEAADTSESAATRSATFETFTGSDDKSYFNFVASNGEDVLRSQGYSSAAALKTGIQSLLDNGLDAHHFVMAEAQNGEWYFNVTAGNGQVIGTSEFYSTKSHAERGARTVQALVRIARKQLDTTPAPTRERFEIFTGVDGQTYFHLRAANGEIMLSSEGYGAEEAAKAGIEAVKEAAADASSFQVFEIDGGWGVRLVSSNGQTIATGESYSSKASATHAVTRIGEILSGTVSLEG